jgi:hypothetical protein
MEDKALPTLGTKHSKRVGFHNQANQKAMGRAQMLEGLTANKGGALGKKGLIFKIMESLARDLDSPNPLIYGPARAEALKMALAMTKDDKAEANSLSELLKSGSNVQINFNSYFSQRLDSDQANPAGQGVTIGFTPPPGPRG